MSLTLTKIPGFADLPDTSLLADTPALGIYLARISNNAAFGMERMEVFVGTYKNGDTVGLPVSAVDGYNYARSELTYLWAVQSSLNPSTGWITGPDSLWYGAWLVNQATGLVSALEWYRRSGSHANPAQSNDGSLQVFTIAQRQRTTLLIGSALTAYTDIADSTFVQDQALWQSLIRGLNDNAKFSVVQGECIYMGEFTDGQTVGRATSPADGYEYTYAEMSLMACWRWTVTGSAFGQPPMSAGQLAPMIWSIDASTGAVSLTVKYVDDSGTLNTMSGYGRVAVFAFCSRSDLIDTIPSTANSFAEIADSVFVPGATLQNTTALQLNKNIREAACSPEFFGPTEYATGDTVPTPTSSLDGYAYSRAELRYLWEWSDTTPASGSNLRVVGWTGSVNSSTGGVSLAVWRLPPGGPVVIDGAGQHMRIRVLVVAMRGATAQSVVSASASAPGDIGSVVADNNPPDINPYAVPFWRGDTDRPSAGERILLHQVPGDVTSMTLPASLTGSQAGCVTAPTGSIQFTLKKSTTLGGTQTTLGTINIAGSANSATFSFSAAIAFSPGDFLHVYAPASQDATLAGFFMTLAGTRT